MLRGNIRIFMLASAIINGVYQSEVGNVFEKIFRALVP
jgi:hypothetical protein